MHSRFLHILLLLLLACASAHAQRQISELESNTDRSMGSRPDSTSRGKGDVVPAEVYAWTVDERYGSVRPVDVDTLHHGFPNYDLPEGRGIGHYNTLGNYGSPRQSRVFMWRKPMSGFFFADPYDMFVTGTESFRFYNTKSPYLNTTYSWCGAKDTGDDHVKVTYTNNAGKRVNIGGIFDYLYGPGFYANQATSFMNASAWASYHGERYKFHFYYQHNFMKMGENGGIEDEGYITHPEEMAGSYGSNDIPTLLSQTWNRQEHDLAFFTHHYALGFFRTDSIDSLTAKREFVPVTKVFHTLKLSKMARNYRAYNHPENYHTYTFMNYGDTINDRTRHLSVKNLVGLSMCEGFNKWALFGLSAYVGYEFNSYRQPLAPAETTGKMSLPQGWTFMPGYGDTVKEHNVLVGGQIVREQGKIVRYSADAEFVVAGENAGQFDLSGHGEANIPLLGDTAQVAVNAYVKNLNPSHYFRHFHSTHAWWDQSTEKEFRQRIEGVLTVPQTKTTLTVGVENIKNFCYFQNDGTVLNAEFGKPLVTNNIAALQYDGSIQVFTANLRQDFRLGILHFDNDVTYQTCSDTDVLPLPSLSTYHNLYLKFKIAKVLNTEIGGDVRYFSEYFAPDYSPVAGMFMNQHEAKKVKIGDYPIVSAYANFLLKRCRFYIQYYHANQNVGRYLWAPGYPMNPAGVRMGISWNFYD